MNNKDAFNLYDGLVNTYRNLDAYEEKEGGSVKSYTYGVREGYKTAVETLTGKKVNVEHCNTILGVCYALYLNGRFVYKKYF